MNVFFALKGSKFFIFIHVLIRSVRKSTHIACFEQIVFSFVRLKIAVLILHRCVSITFKSLTVLPKICGSRKF